MDNFLEIGNIFTPPIQPVGNSLPQKREKVFEAKKPIDNKVRGYVLEKIGNSDLRGALLPTATAPKVMINLLTAALAVPEVEEDRGEREIELMPISRKRKRNRLKKISGKSIPIGLRRCRPHDWVNAWMQFLLFLPGFTELISFLPRSFDPFREFVDQYLHDVQEKEVVSFANGAHLIRCLTKNLPSHLFQNPYRIDLYEMTRFFIKTAFPKEVVSRLASILFYPEWHLIWEMNDGISLEKAVSQKIKSSPPEILIAIKGWETNPAIKRQFFSDANWMCYDLDAFIEYRPDLRNHASYIAYLKIDGAWHQCDDDRITALLSTNLRVPLQRAALLHYQRVGLNHSRGLYYK